MHVPPSAPAPVTTIVFDVGETLIDETRLWSRWAHRLGVTPFAFMGAIGAMAAVGRPLADAFDVVRPGFDVDVELERWAVEDPDGLRESFDTDDLYPDVRPCLARLAAQRVGALIAGNQPPQAGRALAAMGLDVADILISDELGVRKPDPAFFAKIAEVATAPPEQIAYVGDRVDNDVLPAREAGMRAVLIRRGPWGHLHARWPDADKAHHVIDSLDELPGILSK